MDPRAPRHLQKSNLDSLETADTGLPPVRAVSWIAIDPSPPAPPQMSRAAAVATVRRMKGAHVEGKQDLTQEAHRVARRLQVMH